MSNTDAAWQTQHLPGDVRSRQAPPAGNAWDQEKRPPPPHRRPLERKDSKPGPPRPPPPKQMSREGSTTTPPSGRSFDREDVPMEDRQAKESRQVGARQVGARYSFKLSINRNLSYRLLLNVVQKIEKYIKGFVYNAI